MSTKQAELVFHKGKNVVLRPLLRADIPLLMRWINDPETNAFLMVRFPMMEATEEKFIDQVANDQEHNMVLMIVVDGNPVGTIGLHRIDYKSGTAITGTIIGEKDARGKGYGTEAKMLLLDFAFNNINLRKIYSNVLSFNKRSYKYGMKCGYELEATLKKHTYKHGKYWDEHILSVYKKKWLPLWKQFKKEQGIEDPYKH